MIGIIQLIVLYVVFSAISSFVSRNKALQKQQGQKPTFLPKKTSQLPSFLQEQWDNFKDEFQDTYQPVPTPPEHDALELDENDIEFVSEELPAERVPPLPEIPAPTKRPRRPKAIHAASLIIPDSAQNYLQGIILSEILGPPVSKRPLPRQR